MNYRFNTTIKRSRLMQRIRSKETAPELYLHKALTLKGIKYKKNYSKLTGNPDIVILGSKVLIFVDGEFWHGYHWKDKKEKIKANRGYWIPKIERTILRDKRNNRILRKYGWTVLRFWEKDIWKDIEKCTMKIIKTLNSK